MILGLGCGWDANEFANLGLPFPPVPDRQAALEEAIAIIRGAWGDEPFTFSGRHFRTTDARVAPPPQQRPGPPLLLAGGGERVTLSQVAQYADACQLSSFGMVSDTGAAEEIARKLDVLRGHCDALSRPYDTVLRTHFTGWLLLAENDDRLQAKVRRAVPEGIAARYSVPGRGSPWPPPSIRPLPITANSPPPVSSTSSSTPLTPTTMRRSGYWRSA